MIACKKCNELTPRLIVYLIVFKIKGSKTCHFEPCGIFLFSIWFRWDFFHWIPLKKAFICEPTDFCYLWPFRENWCQRGKKRGVKGEKRIIYFFKISHRILTRFVANKSLWKMQQQLYTNTFLYLTVFEIQEAKEGCKGNFNFSSDFCGTSFIVILSKKDLIARLTDFCYLLPFSR